MDVTNQPNAVEDILEIDGLEYEIASAGSTERAPIDFKWCMRLPEESV